LSDGQPICPKQLLFTPAHSAVANRSPQRKTINEVEREHIREILHQKNWNVRDAAKTLGIPRSSLYTKLKEYSLTRPSSEAEDGKSEAGETWEADRDSRTSSVPEIDAPQPSRRDCDTELN
jgi:hypothetical protein